MVEGVFCLRLFQGLEPGARVCFCFVLLRALRGLMGYRRWGLKGLLGSFDLVLVSPSPVNPKSLDPETPKTPNQVMYVYEVKRASKGPPGLRGSGHSQEVIGVVRALNTASVRTVPGKGNDRKA